MPEPVLSSTPGAYELATSEATAGTKFRLQLVVVNGPGVEEVHEVMCIEREEVEMETLGLTLAEGKLILKKIQEALARRRHCPDCGKARNSKGITTLPFALCLGTST